MTPATFITEIKCSNGHEQRITFHDVEEAFVRTWCGLVDGTSHFYVHQPGPESVIGKCAICRQPITARVVE